jgi:hypothetical protein
VIRGIAGIDKEKWIFSFRYFPELLPRARVRTTLQYRLHPRLLVGVEYNPLADEVAPLANVTLLSETKHRPAILASTSTDRIGTPDGQSFTLTAGKDLEPWLHLPIAPYAGVSYGTYDDRFRAIGGLQIRLYKDFYTLITFDGVHVHPVVTYNYGPHAFSLLLYKGRDPGVSYSILF